MPDSIAIFPANPCRACKSTDWWFNGVTWVCGRCHPSGDPKIELKFRVIKGNHKLFKVHRQIIGIGPGEARQKALDQYLAALEVLKDLNRRMKELSMTECLYIQDSKKVRKCLSQEEKFFCHVCCNDWWWEKEMAELGRRKDK